MWKKKNHIETYQACKAQFSCESEERNSGVSSSFGARTYYGLLSPR